MTNHERLAWASALLFSIVASVLVSAAMGKTPPPAADSAEATITQVVSANEARIEKMEKNASLQAGEMAEIVDILGVMGDNQKRVMRLLR